MPQPQKIFDVSSSISVIEFRKIYLKASSVRSEKQWNPADLNPMSLHYYVTPCKDHLKGYQARYHSVRMSCLPTQCCRPPVLRLHRSLCLQIFQALLYLCPNFLSRLENFPAAYFCYFHTAF